MQNITISFGIIILFSILWSIIMLFLFLIRWISSIIIPSFSAPIEVDLRQNKNQHGRKILLCAVKANPLKSIYFGHIWVVWPEATPFSNGIKEAGFYAYNRIHAFLDIILAIIAPFGIFFKQKPLKGIMRNDEGLHRDWQISIEIDEENYQKALEIDNLWRNESRYSLRPAKDGCTYNCRDYVYEIANILGLKTKYYGWWDFPSHMFLSLLQANNLQIITPNRQFFGRLARA
ncbi:MAG: hypothetical protein J0L55_15555 [Caulobacterales bacterium]|nr:hypothetical protein [Caulobacterales bacterium]